ncbi:hypothetical protein AXG93_2294s1280 [Marchantia polymorpha subsp. ruderalis]|uniref:Protein kinase domain-containing protein n=1 Tax=Marchantia polymorpha subsp. ruderalis TaxID=1480154 RepID=A0A176WEH8_MARPO|nr:hypothetical protein AXG93_2294s1280 [Marchantia polymorpha subsp. ruderalis]
MMTSTALLQATLLLLCIICSSAQSPNFLSIDCGATINYTDSKGIDWVTDDGYISTGLNVEVGLSAVPGQEHYSTSRYFPDSRNKHCYVVPAVARTTYLIRAVVLHGGASVFGLPVKFSVTVNSNVWFTRSVTLNDPTVNTPVVSECIIFSTKKTIDVCVVRGPDGTPYLSSLEFRVMPPGTYVTAEGADKFMENMWRMNTGPGANDQVLVRYPDDQYDRFWFPASPADFPTPGLISNTTALQFPETYGIGYNIPPEAVLKDAWEGPDLSWSWLVNSDTTRIYLSLYFQEIRKNVTVSTENPVGIYIIIDGDPITVFEYNITERFPRSVYYNYDVAGSEVNVTILTQPWSQADAILNAMELYDVRDINTTYTLAKDVTTLQLVKEKFNLTSWTGDPCYPASYNWVACDGNNRISILFLSNMNLTGDIPSEIGDLAALREIYMDNNDLTGGIPTSLTLLATLSTLSLDNNSLSGGIPTSLQNRNGFTFSGNPNLTLCQPTDAQCNNPDPGTGSSSSSNTGIIIGVVIGVIVAVIFATGLTVYLVRKNKGKEPVGGALAQYSGPGIANLSGSSYDIANSRSSVSASDLSAPSLPPDRVHAFKAAGLMSMREVLTATRNHSKKIGEGGYGPVYYGKLPNGREVAVKVNKIGANQGSPEFVNEVALLTRVHHRNLVSLLGFCEENDERILVYEYQHNGTLSDLLYGPNAAANPLNWRTRLDLALNAAKGLEYLHIGCNPRIIHRDIKSSNILIDDKMVAKVADFGISKSTPEQTMTVSAAAHVSNVIRGTPGYIDPEYLITHVSSEMSDVFSFGVVLMEIVAGRPPFTIDDHGVPFILQDMMRRSMVTNDIYSIVDPALGGQFNPESVWKMCDVALASVQREGVNRPTMTEVVKGLTEAMEMEFSSSNTSGRHTMSSQLSRTQS